MALTIICVTGPSNTGKSSTIRQFTAERLKYRREADVLGVLPMPRRNYAVGLNSYGDNIDVVRDGLAFLDQYAGLRVMIVACHLENSVTFQEIANFARRRRAQIHNVRTFRLSNPRAQNAAIRGNVREIVRLMPPRDR